jgi:hypothetical protein
MKLKYLLLIIVGFFLMLKITNELMFINSKTACGNFVYSASVRGSTYVHYVVIKDGEKHFGSTPTGSLKIKNLTELKKVDCVVVEYSVYSGWFSRVIDDRVMEE